MKTRATAIVTFIILIVLVVWMSLYIMADKSGSPLEQPAPVIPTPTIEQPQPVVMPPEVVLPKPATAIPGSIFVHIGETGAVGDTAITPSEVIEDSRCPLGMMCIQAGRVRVDAAVHVGGERTKQTFLVGEPFIFSGKLITLTTVLPERKQGETLAAADYVFTFRVEAVPVEYVNASADTVRVSSPPLGAVVGKQFEVRGEARGMWFFEASFPVEVRDVNRKIIARGIAKAGGDWMTTSFVPFTATLTVSEKYIGDATVVLKKDNPSGMPEKDGSMTFPIHIEY